MAALRNLAITVLSHRCRQDRLLPRGPACSPFGKCCGRTACRPHGRSAPRAPLRVPSRRFLELGRRAFVGPSIPHSGRLPILRASAEHLPQRVQRARQRAPATLPHPSSALPVTLTALCSVAMLFRPGQFLGRRADSVIYPRHVAHQVADPVRADGARGGHAATSPVPNEFLPPRLRVAAVGRLPARQAVLPARLPGRRRTAAGVRRASPGFAPSPRARSHGALPSSLEAHG
jgi:hypothetical protein